VDLLEAYYRMETVEHFAEITLAARALGGPSPLSQEEVRKLLKVREKLGIRAPSEQCFACGACDSPQQGVGGSPTQGGQKEDQDRGASAGQADADEDIVRTVLREVEKALGSGQTRD
jgi:hypothetical protein